MSNLRKQPKIGDIYLMHFSGKDSEQDGLRPGVIIQNNVGNIHSPNVIALPLTSVIKKTSLPTHVVLKAEDTGLKKDSMVLCENPTTMSKERLEDYVTTISDNQMKDIATAHTLACPVISFVDKDTLLALRKQASALNAVGKAA